MNETKGKRAPRLDYALALTMVLSAVLHGYGIWTDRYANTYYTTAVGSMLQSWHNFFFVALDSAGSVTVDKPPLTFWIQALSAKIFGLRGWSVILPQALCGVLSVWLLYKLVKPMFGTTAARVSALAMATMPVAVAVGRTNNIDGMLVFALLSGTWLLFKGIRSGKAGWIVGAFAVVGLAFNMKMLQAYMILPAFYLLFLISYKATWRKKSTVAAVATATLLVASLSWALIVDAVPKSERPYIGSSTGNSVLELAFGYNGVSRLTGDRNPGGSGGGVGFGGGRGIGPGGFERAGQGERAGQADGTDPSDQVGARNEPSFQGGVNGLPGAAAMGGFGANGDFGGGSGGMFGTGEEGPLRLFQSELSGQASWLVPFAALGAIALLWGLSFRQLTAKQEETIFWLAWLVPVMGFFSVAGFFHPYYLIMMGPPIAALVGGGWSELRRLFRESAGWRSALLPVAIAATTSFAWIVIQPNDDRIGHGWSIVVLFGGLLVGLILAISQWSKQAWARRAAWFGLVLMLAGPLYWSLTPIVYGQNSMLPQAGFSSEGRGQGAIGGGSGQPGGGQGGANVSLLSYLRTHNTGETYLFAAQNYGTAAPYIIDEREKVVTLNGFSGGDRPYSAETLRALVASGKVKYFLIGEGMGGPGGGQRGSSELTAWIQENGTEIPSSEWGESASANGNAGGRGGFGFGNAMKLYEVSAGR
ncbi:glycosyltransferase family 39 protein [Cohnella suwonensis]|uniref:Glycosyltransferase family 39 protein n=1 Tax=Cohnella suwonensis TaxID=696072 RepID=A0ABW0LVL6_9BACL